ncbi:uncharacterized protein F5147DRAFT_664437 [Suillus discolor]|uniref:Uncharacterized protein n=1 Tax=Suillus discolor TaxID=1912936 RepID=A0A9P7FI85_9AGAM|nr:uncharacterized protein F5147DRAFT_664437 [Suillus discolor]KAG2119520.1 hypothetical protein F5147DRAFT_664437 [Suillus discolor]
MADTIQVLGCVCIWCRRNSESDGDSQVERGQPSQSLHPRIPPRKVCDSPIATTSEVLEVLYPPSHLDTPTALDPEASPPAYELRPTVPPNTPQDQLLPISFRDGRGLVPFTPCPPQVTPSMDAVSSYHLSDTPLDVAVPSSQSPRQPSTGIVRQPITGCSLESHKEVDNVEPPAYSRFDSSRPRFPAASDILGPYPHISMLSPNLG